MTPISDEEMRFGRRYLDRRSPSLSFSQLIGQWCFHNADGTFTSVRCDTDDGDVDDAGFILHRLEESHVIVCDRDDDVEPETVYRAESEPDPTCNGELRTVRREQLWPYVPPEVDVEAEIARLREFEKVRSTRIYAAEAGVTVRFGGHEFTPRDIIGIDYASEKDEPRTGLYGGGGFTWASDPIVITTAHAESQLPDCLLPAPDHLAMLAKRPGWYAMTGHEYRLWGPPTAKHLRTLSPKTIKRKIRRAERQGRHIHACDVAMENTRQPRAEPAARRAAARAQARWRRKQWKRMDWVAAAQRLGTVAGQAFNRAARLIINGK